MRTKLRITVRIAISRFLPACLLLLVAGRQFFLVWSEDLTQWKGGGFGMFSTVDAGSSRVVQLRADNGTKCFKLQYPQSPPQVELYRLAHQLPSARTMRLLLEDIGRTPWGISERNVRNVPSTRLTADGLKNAGLALPELTRWLPGLYLVPIKKLQLAIYVPVYSRATKRLSWTLLKQATAGPFGDASAFEETALLDPEYLNQCWTLSQ